MDIIFQNLVISDIHFTIPKSSPFLWMVCLPSPTARFMALGCPLDPGPPQALSRTMPRIGIS